MATFRTILFTLFSFAFMAVVQADSLKLPSQEVYFQEPKGWTVKKMEMGSHLMWIAPTAEEDHAQVFYLYDLGDIPEALPVDQIQKGVAEYYKGRLEYVKILDNAKYTGDLPYDVFKGNKLSGYRVGFEFQLGQEALVERSFYFSCDKRLYHGKSLFSKKHDTQLSQELLPSVQGITCKTLSHVNDFQKDKKWIKKLEQDFFSDEMAAHARKAMLDFMLAVEERQFFGQESASKGKDRLFLEAMFRMLQLNPNAYAASGAECFVGGWPSVYVKKDGKKVCKAPDGELVEKFRKMGAVMSTSCPANFFTCNPVLFGVGTCLPTHEGRMDNATIRCDSESKARVSRGEFLTFPDRDEYRELIQKTVGVVGSKCGDENYQKNNLGLCRVLYQHVQSNYADLSIDLPDLTSPDQLDDRLKTVEAQIELFEKTCVDPKTKNIYAEFLEVPVEDGTTVQVNCKEEAEKLKRNLARVENVALANEELEDLSCREGVKPDCDPLKKQMNAQKCSKDMKCFFGATAAQIVTLGGATVIGAFQKNDPASCNLASNGCVSNMAAGIGKSLWGMVKGIGQLLGFAWNNIYGMAQGSVNAVTRLFGFGDVLENESGKKALAGWTMAKEIVTSPSQILPGMWKAFEEFAKNDVFCEKWSGAPHVSKCEIPMTSWECLDCKTKANGICGIAGVAMSEITAMFLTGGISGAITKSNLVAKIGAKLSMLSKSGKFSKLAAKSVRGAGKAVKASYNLGKKIVGPVIRGATKLLKKVDGYLTKSKTWLGKTLTAPYRWGRSALSKYASLRDKAFKAGFESFGPKGRMGGAGGLGGAAADAVADVPKPIDIAPGGAAKPPVPSVAPGQPSVSAQLIDELASTQGAAGIAQQKLSQSLSKLEDLEKQLNRLPKDSPEYLAIKKRIPAAKGQVTNAQNQLSKVEEGVNELKAQAFGPGGKTPDDIAEQMYRLQQAHAKEQAALTKLNEVEKRLKDLQRQKKDLNPNFSGYKAAEKELNYKIGAANRNVSKLDKEYTRLANESQTALEDFQDLLGKRKPAQEPVVETPVQKTLESKSGNSGAQESPKGEGASGSSGTPESYPIQSRIEPGRKSSTIIRSTDPNNPEFAAEIIRIETNGFVKVDGLQGSVKVLDHKPNSSGQITIQTIQDGRFVNESVPIGKIKGPGKQNWIDQSDGTPWQNKKDVQLEVDEVKAQPNDLVGEQPSSLDANVRAEPLQVNEVEDYIFVRAKKSPPPSEQKFINAVKNSKEVYRNLLNELGDPKMKQTLVDKLSNPKVGLDEYKKMLQEHVRIICGSTAMKNLYCDPTKDFGRVSRNPDEFLGGEPYAPLEYRYDQLKNYIDVLAKERGIPPAATTYTNGNLTIKFSSNQIGKRTVGYDGRRYYQVGDDDFFEAGRKHFVDALKAKDNDQLLTALSDYYHTMAHTRPFAEGNNTMFMTQVNAVLAQRGLKPMTHGILDHLAHHLNYDDFRVIFKSHQKNFLPEDEAIFNALNPIKGKI